MTEEAVEKYDPIYKLKDPRKNDGVEITEINLNMEKISAQDLDRAEDIFNTKKYKANVMELSKKYSIIVAHLASDLPLDFFETLSGRDYQQIHFKVAGFLNG